MTQGLPAWWLASASTIIIDLTPSRLRRVLCLSVILLALGIWGGLLLFTPSPWLLLPMLLVLAGAWREVRADRRSCLQRLSIHPVQGLLWTDARCTYAIDSALCLPWVVVLRCRPLEGRGRWHFVSNVFVWRDSVPPATHRALRRWLRQREAQGATGTTGSA